MVNILFNYFLVTKQCSVKEFLSNYFNYQNSHTKLNSEIPKMPLLDFSSLLGYPEYQFQLKKLYEVFLLLQLLHYRHAQKNG